MQEVAATAATWARNRTLDRNPRLGWFEDLDGISATDLRRHICYSSPDKFAGHGVTHEEGATAPVPDEVTAVRDISDAQLDNVAATYWIFHPSLSMTVSLDSSCHGTLVTMTPGVKSRRDLRRSAD